MGLLDLLPCVCVSLMSRGVLWDCSVTGLKLKNIFSGRNDRNLSSGSKEVEGM